MKAPRNPLSELAVLVLAVVVTASVCAQIWHAIGGAR